MKKFAICIGFLFLNCSGWSVTCPSGFSYYRSVTINASAMSSLDATETNFPVLISTNEVTLSTTSGSGGHLANSSGYDLVFSTYSDGTAYYLKWDTETVQVVNVSTMNVWVNVPSISSTTNTTIYMYYGNSGITSYMGFSTATWDSNYKNVYHFGSGSSLSLIDSTSNGKTLTNNGSVPQTAGKINNAASFSGSLSVYLESVSSSLSGDITVELWRNATTTAIGSFLYQTITGGSRTGAHIPYADNTLYWDYGDSGSGRLTANYTSYDNLWTHIVLVGKGNNTFQAIYLNGSKISSQTTGNAPTSISDLVIGLGMGGNTDTGKTDEFRISNVIRGAGWIQNEYNNQNSPTTFVTIGAENACSAGHSGPSNVIFFGNPV